MRNFVCTLLLLSLSMSAAIIASLMFRRFVLRGRQALMRNVWIFVILIGLIPLIIPMQPVGMPGKDENIVTVSANPNESVGKYSTIQATDSVLQNDGSVVMKYHASKLDALYFPQVVFIMWLAGFCVSLAMLAHRYQKISFLFMANSYVIPHSERFDYVNEMFSTLCTEICGRKKVRLRIMNAAMSVSPCVCGIFRPTVYISEETLGFCNEKFRLVILHELFHVKNHDVAYKLVANIAECVHWFNPISQHISSILSEDIEFFCDCEVLRKSRGSRKIYMEALIDTAQTTRTGFEESEGGLFLVRHNSDVYMRRFENMKKLSTRKKSSAPFKIITALFCAAVIMSGTVMMSCGNAAAILPTENKAEKVVLHPAIDDTVRIYYDLAPDDPITQDMLDGITSLNISINPLSDQLGYGTILDITANDSAYGNAVEKYIKENRYEIYISEAIGKIATKENNIVNGFCAFYCLKDPSDPNLTPDEAEEMKALFPPSIDGAVYVLDPQASEREIIRIMKIMYESEIMKPKIITGDTFDASCLKYFKNLSKLTYNGIKIENSPIEAIENLPIEAAVET